MDSLHTVIAWSATFPAWLQEVARYTSGLLLLALIFLPLESFFALRPKIWSRPGFLSDLSYYFLSSLLPNKGVALFVAAFIAAWQFVAPQGLLPVLGTFPLPTRMAISFVVAELGAYAAHRAMHAFPRLWRFHAVHHAATEMHWLVNTRAHPIDLVFTRCCALLPLYMLGLVQVGGQGVDWLPFAVAMLTSLWGYVIHANVRLRFGWLEGLVATPPFHHHHHRDFGSGGINHANFAPTFAIVDRLFGTYEAPAEWPERYGSADHVGNTMLDQIMLPFMPSLRVSEPVNGEPPTCT
jgi:sterol desaturase/sphingolipid hydroxylase (fatty acid hydroxylase superfamily)